MLCLANSESPRAVPKHVARPLIPRRSAIQESIELVGGNTAPLVSAVIGDVSANLGPGGTWSVSESIHADSLEGFFRASGATPSQKPSLLRSNGRQGTWQSSRPDETPRAFPFFWNVQPTAQWLLIVECIPSAGTTVTACQLTSTNPGHSEGMGGVLFAIFVSATLSDISLAAYPVISLGTARTNPWGQRECDGYISSIRLLQSPGVSHPSGSNPVRTLESAINTGCSATTTTGPPYRF